MKIELREIPRGVKVEKGKCPNCGRTIHAVGFEEGSRCEGITVVCKFCRRVYRVTAR